jgi:hypothetical protein
VAEPGTLSTHCEDALKDELILHVGTPKTGSTSIQHFLFNNKRALSAAGFYYPVEGSYYWHGLRSQSVLAHSINDTRPAYLAHTHFEKDTCICDLKRDIMASQARRVIISSEIFTENYTRAGFMSLLDVFSRLFRRVTVLVYLRRQDLWLESNWARLVKIGYTELTFEEYADQEMPWNYHELLSLLADVFGRSNLVARPFERGQLHGRDAVTDFLNVAGIEIDLPVAEITPRNSFPPMELLELFRILNKVVPRMEERLPFANFLQNLPFAYDNARYALFTAEARQRFLNMCRESNHRVAVEFLGRESGELFVESEPSSLPRYPGLTFERMAEILAFALKTLGAANRGLARELRARHSAPQ